MNAATVTLAMIALAAVFALALPLDTAVAQADDYAADGEGGASDDGSYEGKSCPNKEKKSSSVEQSS